MPSLRKSTTTSKPRTTDGGVSYFCSESRAIDEEPLIVEPSLSRPNREMRKQAIDKTLQSFEQDKTWELVDIPENKTTMKC